jgi:hypothetical protein
MDRARHAEERGQVLEALKQNYRAPMTSVRSLAGALDLVGYPMTSSGLEFHLVYLADAGYLRIWRANDLPQYRQDRQHDRRADAILFARLTPRGLQLIDGLERPDPSVRF